MPFSSLYEAIFQLMDPPEKAWVVDLGCRNAGVLCRCMEQFGSRIQKAVGVDARDTGFGEIPYGEPIELRVMDCAQPLDFPDNAFDLVFSKDMFECVTDKEALVQEIGRILKPGGTVLCVNCDWDSVVYNGRDKDLIARAVHAYAVTKQGWMEDLDSWIGRRMFGIFNRSGLFDSSVSVHNVVETEYREGTAGSDFSRHIGWLAEEQTGALTMEEYRAFLRDLEETYRDGTYLFSKPYYLYKGIKKG